MKQSIIRVLGIAPYEGMRAALERAAEAYPQIHLDAYTGDLEEGLQIVQRCHADKYDAIISRGGTAALIRQTTDIPVVEIEMSVYDVLRSIKLAENYSSRYAIVGFAAITEPAHILCDLLRYNVDIVTVHNTKDVEKTLERLQQEGYRMVISDMVTHTVARRMGLDAFLVTSGAESLHNALAQAQAQGIIFRHMRIENQFLRSLSLRIEGTTVVLTQDGSLYFSAPDNPPDDLLASFRARIREVPDHSPLRFYHNANGVLSAVNAQGIDVEGTHLLVFRCHPAQIPLRTGKLGIRTLNKTECDHLFMNSFYSISGAMGELENRLSAIADTRQSVMIIGEPGTGKEQIARAIYLRSPLVSSPLVVVDCTLMDDKNWDYLLGHHSSPLNDRGSTIYFQHLEDLPVNRQSELLSLILETGLTKRMRLIFSCNCMEGSPLPEVGRMFSSRAGCFTLRLPTLRSRSDEIPSLASLYLSSLNQELGKQISGFDPNAIALLRQYDWPHNYTQFKQVLHELATLATSAYIRSSSVAETLAKQRAITRSATLSPPGGVSIEGRTLDEITSDVIEQTVAAHGGNQTAAAQALGISRTTLWRVMNRKNNN